MFYRSEDIYFRFFRKHDEEKYKEYRRIKGEVFGQELSWNIGIDPDGLTSEDTFDSVSLFLGCFTNDGKMFGVVRSTSLKDAFPHKEYFVQCLSPPNMDRAKTIGFTLNAIAIRQEFRGKFLIHEGKCFRTIGSAILEKTFEYYRGYNRIACLLTAIYGKSDKFFLTNGFVNLGDPFEYENMNIQLVNMIRPGEGLLIAP